MSGVSGRPAGLRRGAPRHRRGGRAGRRRSVPCWRRWDGRLRKLVRLYTRHKLDFKSFVWHCVRCWWLVVGCTFDFGADDVDERSEKRRRADETDPVAVTHFASASSAGRQAGQTWHLSDFLVAAAAVITLLHLSMREEIRKRNGHDIQESHPTGTLDDAYNSQSSIKETDKRTNEQCAVTGTPKKSLSF